MKPTNKHKATKEDNEDNVRAPHGFDKEDAKRVIRDLVDTSQAVSTLLYSVPDHLPEHQFREFCFGLCHALDAVSARAKAIMKAEM